MQAGGLITGTGAALPAGSTIVTVLVGGALVTPHSSVTVRVTV